MSANFERMEHKIDKLLEQGARIEANQKTMLGRIDKHEGEIEALQRKWWSGVGAFVLALSLWIKSIASNLLP